MKATRADLMNSISEAVKSEDWEMLYKYTKVYISGTLKICLDAKGIKYPSNASLGLLQCTCILNDIHACSNEVVSVLECNDYTQNDSVLRHLLDVQYAYIVSRLQTIGR